MFKSINPARNTQRAISAGFLSFGAAWLFAPKWLESLFAAEPSLNLPVVTLGLAVLGTHAIAAGLFAAFARFKSWTFPGYALAILPALVIDYWLYAKVGAVSEMILLHAGGMIAMLALCVRGFRQLQRHENAYALPA